MVEIDSNVILVDPIKNRTDADLTRAYCAMMLRLKQVGIIPQKHILDNEVSNAIKTIIRDEYKMKLELVHQVAIVAMRKRWPFETSKHISSAYWRVQKPASRQHYWTDCYHKTR